MQENKPLSPAELSLSPEAEEAYLSKLARMIFKSFEYSQGIWLYQAYAFEYLHAIRPEWEISETQLPILKKMVFEKVEGRFKKYNAAPAGHISVNRKSNHPAMRDKSMDVNVGDILEKLSTAFKAESDKERALKTLIILTLQRDIHYLIFQDGRPRRREAGENPRTEPWMSHTHFFIGRGHPDSDSEFAHMFSEMRSRIRDKIISGEYVIHKDIDIRAERKKMESEQATYRKSVVFPAVDVMLSMVSQRWEKHHPGEDFFAPFDLPPELGFARENQSSRQKNPLRRILLGKNA